MNAEQSLADGAAGTALLHLEIGNEPAALAALRRATAGGVSTAAGASLYFGAPALAFVLAATDHPRLARARAVTAAGTRTVVRRRLQTAHRRIDNRRLPHFAEYDLIRGLTGLGVVLRRIGEPNLLRDVLDYLVRLTEPVNDLPGWWCWNGPDYRQPPPVGGHANLGMAHGITGPLALLSLTARDGVTVPGQTAAITRICHWLDLWQQSTNEIIWWPQTLVLADLDRGVPFQRTPLRPSWCYGTPGIARAQQLAARALWDSRRRTIVEAAFSRCLTDPGQTGLLVDRSLCHGTAGLHATARRIRADAAAPVPTTEALHQPTVVTGHQGTGLLTGSAGPELVAAATTTTGWDACLLIA